MLGVHIKKPAGGDRGGTAALTPSTRHELERTMTQELPGLVVPSLTSALGSNATPSEPQIKLDVRWMKSALDFIIEVIWHQNIRWPFRNTSVSMW
jgi:hypothetical protein